MIKEFKINKLRYYLNTDNFNIYLNNFPKNDKAIVCESKEENISKITIIMTTKCNGSCIYCYQKNNKDWGSNADISEKTLDNIEQIIKNLKHIDCISFFGGEALLEYENIRKIIDKIEENGIGINSYEITTNGLLLNKERINYLLEKNFKIIVSVDGPKIIQSVLRPNCNIDDLLEYLKCASEEIKEKFQFNCTYTKFHNDISSYNEICDYFEDFRIKYSITNVFTDNQKLSIRVDYKKQIDASIYNLLVDTFNVTLEGHLATVLNAFYFNRGQKFFCNDLKNTITIDENGNEVLCTGLKTIKNKETADRYNDKNAICKKCWALNLCSRCIANDIENNVDKHDKCVDLKAYSYAIRKLLKLHAEKIDDFNLLFDNYHDRYLK